MSLPPDTKPPPTPDPSDLSEMVTSPGRGKVDVVADLDSDATKAREYESLAAKNRLRAEIDYSNSHEPSGTELLNQGPVAIVRGTLHSIRVLADKLRPALAEAVMRNMIPIAAAVIIQGVIVAVDATDNIVGEL